MNRASTSRSSSPAVSKRHRSSRDPPEKLVVMHFYRIEQKDGIMRSIVNSTFVSLDGIVNHMERWHFDFIDDDVNTIALDQLLASDALLMGRKTYEGYAAAWPTRDDEYSDRINAIQKYVVSTTLTAPEWKPTTVINGDLVERVRELKRKDGDNILMHGFGPVAKTLLREGLLDELHLWYHPAFAGVGGPDDMLFTPDLNVKLRHTETTTLKSGIVILSYHAETS
jgi:dihydrofolate reductase